jgi:ADP-ribosylglycohydrolase
MGRLADRFISRFDAELFELDITDIRERHPSAGWLKSCTELKKRIKKITEEPSYSWWKLGSWWACGNGEIHEITVEGHSDSAVRAWPIGLVFNDDIEKVKQFAAAQSLLTNRNPMAVASSVALAVGVAYAIRGNDPKEVVEAMIKAAKEYESTTNPNAEIKRVIEYATGMLESAADKESIDFEQFRYPKRPSTSEMIQEAYNTATSMSSADKEQIIGNLEEKHIHRRKFYEKRQGWPPDESVASAAFTFLLYDDDIRGALSAAVNTPGNKYIIACMAGALVGARTGAKDLVDDNLPYLESVVEFIELAKKIAVLHK